MLKSKVITNNQVKNSHILSGAHTHPNYLAARLYICYPVLKLHLIYQKLSSPMLPGTQAHLCYPAVRLHMCYLALSFTQFHCSYPEVAEI